jgi:hypothetical protein
VTAKTYVGRRLLVVLYPVDESEGTWRLGTAMDDDGNHIEADRRRVREHDVPVSSATVVAGRRQMRRGTAP